MARKLDRNRPFGEIYGHAEARFEQHGILFDSDENELPGFEDVKIPEHIPMASGADANVGRLMSDLEEQRRQNARLQAENDRLKLQTAEDGNAAVEEVQGKLDSANVEIARLNGLVADLQAQLAGSGTDTANKDKGKKSEVDKQLDLQGKS